jgi:hypothetical protein
MRHVDDLRECLARLKALYGAARERELDRAGDDIGERGHRVRMPACFAAWRDFNGESDNFRLSPREFDR